MLLLRTGDQPMIHLSDTQRILLSSASQRESGSVLPLPPCITVNGGTMKSVDALVKRDLAEERETSEAGVVRRTDGDVRYGVFITATGLAAIGVSEPEGGAAGGHGIGAVAPSAPLAKTSKTALVLDLLRRPAGATLAELIKATGWLPHTIRAALTGIRKKGHDVERMKRADATCYRIVVA